MKRREYHEHCQWCGGPISGYSTVPRKYHKDCDRIRYSEASKRTKEQISTYMKLGQKEKRALAYIGKYIQNPENLTPRQIKDICGSYGADYKLVKPNIELERIAARKENCDKMDLSTE